jgi:diphosphomevalonate decarboxylase
LLCKEYPYSRGKRDESLILPINSSLSGTIDQGSMCSLTQIIASKSYEKDEIWLNHKQESISNNKRLLAVIEALRNKSNDYYDSDSKTILIHSKDWKDYRFHIYSVNNFPTAAGLASSAAGYACFTYCLATLLGFKESYDGNCSLPYCFHLFCVVKYYGCKVCG